MRFDDKVTGLCLVIKGDLRQRALNQWNAALREWRISHQVMDVPLRQLSNNEYNCGVLYAAVKAGWIEASGRQIPDSGQPERLTLTQQDALPAQDAPNLMDALDDLPPALVQWYGEKVQLAYAQLFIISPN